MNSQEIYKILIEHIAPLYIMMLLGYISERNLHVKRESISKLLIYIIVPFVVFYSSYKLKFKTEFLLLPLVLFILPLSLSQIFLALGKKIWKHDSTKNLLAFTVGTSNTGYFGLPILFALFGSEGFYIGVYFQIGVSLFENSLGMYTLARGSLTIKDSLLKLSRVPIIYAFILGVIMSITNIKLGNIIDNSFELFRGAYSMLGMMIIGMGLAKINRHSFDFKYIIISLFAKTLIWPAIILFLIYLDTKYTQIYSVKIYKIAIIIACIPVGANSVAYATEFRTHPEKAALAVLLSTSLALIYLPLIIVTFNLY